MILLALRIFNATTLILYLIFRMCLKMIYYFHSEP